MSNKPEEKYFTVVFKVSNPEVFAKTVAKYTDSMMCCGQVGGAIVTGLGWEDSMTKVDAYEQHLRFNDLDPDEVVREFLEETQEEE